MTEVDRAKNRARINAHRANLIRYRDLLAGELTEAERDSMQRRMIEERAVLVQLIGAPALAELPA